MTKFSITPNECLDELVFFNYKFLFCELARANSVFCN